MCGFAGYLSQNISANEELVMDMVNAVSSRGPDSEGYWLDKENCLAFGHKRLSIIDLSEHGNQPIESNNKKYLLVFNGEIYNHNDLRKELNSEYKFLWKGNSDTETLIECLSLWGIDKTLNKINGMFSFAFWDREKKILRLARDRLGEKPLYFGFINQTFVFGSQLKCFSKFPNWDKRINLESLELYMRYGYVPAPYSIFEDLYKLESGQVALIKKEDFYNVEKYNYWNLEKNVLSFKTKYKNLSKKEHESLLKEMLESSIKKRMISDVPLGAFLSGGLDSSVIVTLMQKESSKPVKTFTMGFKDKNYDETRKAKSLAKFLATEHNEFLFDDQDILSTVNHIGNVWDEPFSDISQIPTLLICQKASKEVKVILSGDGGDELFCGYNRYLKGLDLYNLSKNKYISLFKDFIKNKTNYASKIFKESQKEKIEKLIYSFQAKSLNEYYLKVIEIFNPDDTLLKFKFNNNFSPINKVKNFADISEEERLMYFDILQYLPEDIMTKIDRASMSIGLEARSPFLDHNLAGYSLSIPIENKKIKGFGKKILRDVLGKYLPDAYLDHSKKGFSVPVSQLLSGPLKKWSTALIEKEINSRDSVFNPNRLKMLISEKHFEIRKSQKIWTILMFLTWKESFFENKNFNF